MQTFYALRFIATDFFAAQADRLVFWMPVAFAAGAGVYFGLKVEPFYLYTCFALLFAAFFQWDCRKSPEARIFALFVLLFVSGFFAAQTRTIALSRESLKSRMKTTLVSGTVDQVVRLPDLKARLVLKDLAFDGKTDWRTPEKMRLNLLPESPLPDIGDKIEVKALPSPPRVKVDKSGYDSARTLYFEKIGGTGAARSPVKVVEKSTETSLRRKIAKRIDAVLPPRTAHIAKALVTGESKEIDPALADAYRNAGIAHILAVSGLHMTLIAGFVFFLVRSLLALSVTVSLKFSTKKIAAFCALAATFCYLKLAGAPISGIRAFIMLSFALGAVFFDRRALSLANVCWAAFLILLFTPESLLSVSFQLSFAAVLALICAYEAGIDKAVRRLEQSESVLLYLLAFALGILLTSLTAGIATAPFAAYHFKRIANYTLLGNLLTTTFAAAWVMPSLFAAVMLMPFGMDAPLWKLAGIGIEVINRAAEFTSNLPHSVTLVPAMPFYGLMCAVFGGLWVCLWRGKVRFLGFIPFCFAFATPFLTAKPDVMMTQSLSAFRRPDGILSFTKGDKFTRSSWLSSAGTTDFTQTDCSLCLYEKNGVLLAFARTKTAAKQACGTIDFLFVKNGCEQAFRLPESGALFVYVENGKIRTEHVGGEYRPWTPSYPSIRFKDLF